jgi:hypothetical protein
MSVGLMILLLVTVLIWPDPKPAAPGRVLGSASD